MENPLIKYLAFVKTVERGSFTYAARDLKYAQSSISKMVADLEKEWGMTLLERSKNGVCLTSAGKQIMPFLRKLLNDYHELEGQICRMNGLETGIVRVGAFSSVSINWLPDIFGRLQKDFPGIEYEILMGDYDEIERWIEEGRVDCGFLRLPAGMNFDTVFLKRDEYKVVLPEGHALAEKETISPEDLNNLPFLLLEHGGKTEVSNLLEQYGIRPDIRFTTWEDFAIMAMVERGAGISILPDLILQRIPYKIEIRSMQEPFYRSIGLAMKNREHLTPAVQKFLEYLPFREEDTGPIQKTCGI
jgi:DNA-binding transcriptional LysR family regulator